MKPELSILVRTIIHIYSYNVGTHGIHTETRISSGAGSTGA